MRQSLITLMLVLATALPLGAGAADPVRIGMITTLSGGGSSLGVDVRDGFMLAVEQGDGRLGGVPVEVLVEDDGRKVGRAVQIAQRMLQREDADIMTGIIWSNLALAVVPRVARNDTFYISPNAGPSQFAGKDCHARYFNVAWQNDNLHEAMGAYVSDQGHETAYLLAPNYPAGKDALAGFKRYYEGEVVGEVYTKLGQLDYAAELAALREAEPDSVYFFLPGGMGINFIKQYAQAGLKEQTPLFGPAFSFDEGILSATGDAALGVINSSQWAIDLDNAANRQFVEAFQAKHERRPSLYASQGYDAARLIASALAAVDGDVDDARAFRAALEAADFASVRGGFRFNHNHHPIQDIYVREVYRTDDGTLSNRTIGKAFEDHADAYAGECGLSPVGG
ncbi:MAG: ABC transporter substrate-binding protein [Halofilum sp. (in: g-proteobacteria)]|nr:ABC transporter substrate-binding protein [Halofilum sp. (in: g-proteobacteria)]